MDEGPIFSLAHQQQAPVRDPQECLDEGVWQVEPIYYQTSSRCAPKRGKAYKCIESGEFVCFESHDGCVYHIGGELNAIVITSCSRPVDNVYLDSQQADAAYHICGILGFKLVRFCAGGIQTI